MKKEVSSKIKILNFIFTLFIVLGHFVDKTDYKIKLINHVDFKIYNFYFVSLKYIIIISMTFFFMMSGFLLYSNIEKTKEILKKLKSRLKTLLMPFLIWNTTAIVFILMVDKILDKQTIQINSLYAFINYFFLSPVNVPLWYMEALIIFLFFAPFVIVLKKSKICSYIIYIFIIIFWLLYQFNIIPTVSNFGDWWWVPNLIQYIPAYFSGVFLGLNYGEIIRMENYEANKYCFYGMIILFLSIVLFIIMKGVLFNLIFLFAILIIIGIWLILKGDLFYNKKNEICNTSFCIYVMHQAILIPIINKIIVIILKDVNLIGIQFVITRIIGLIMIVTCVNFIYLIIKKYIPKNIVNLILGGRG